MRAIAANNNIVQFGFFALLLLAVVLVGRGPTYDVAEISVGDAQDEIRRWRPFVIDVRGREAYDKGHVPGALSVPLDKLEDRLDALPIAKTDRIIVYCNDGVRTGPKATALLNERGYSNAVNMKAGIEGWRGANLPVEK